MVDTAVVVLRAVLVEVVEGSRRVVHVVEVEVVVRWWDRGARLMVEEMGAAVVVVGSAMWASGGRRGHSGGHARVALTLVVVVCAAGADAEVVAVRVADGGGHGRRNTCRGGRRDDDRSRQ